MAEAEPTAPLHEDFSNAEYAKQFMDRLSKVLEKQKYTDVTLKSDEVEIPCHRAILAAASDYFETMFSSGLKESSSDVVDITGTDPETLKALVKYMYSSNIQITTNNVQSLVQAADQYQFTGLVTPCESFMVKHVNPSNSVDLYRFSKTYSLKDLKDITWKMMLKEFPDVVRSTEFSNMAVEEIIEYISDNALNVATEDAVFDAVCMWVRFDPKEREALFSQIVEHIRLPLCTKSYLSQAVVSYPLMGHAGCQKYLQEALKYLMVPGQHHETSSPRTKPRDSFNTYRSCLVVVESDCFKITYFKEDGSEWTQLTRLQEDIELFSAVIFKQGIFITGGCLDMKQPKNECEFFDMRRKEWTSLPSMSMARYFHGSTVHNEQVYVAGGQDRLNGCMMSVEMYDHNKCQWSVLPKMPKPLTQVIAVSSGQYVCVLSRVTVDLFAYDTVWGKWEKRTDLPHVVNYGSATTLKDKIYIVGGSSPCLQYDMQLDSWTILTSPRGGLSLVVAGVLRS